MSVGGKKEKTKTQSVTTPTNPQWVTDSMMGLQNRINALGNADPYSYVAGPSALQQKAFSGAGNLGTSQNYDWASQLGLSAGMAGPNMAAGTSAGPAATASSRNITDLNLNDYLNAGLGDQITATQADYDATGGRARAAQAMQAAANGGARNSNNAVRAAIMEGELSRAANTGIANVRAHAYDQAGNLATNDLNREASTNQFNAGQSNSMSQFNTGQANAMSQFNAGQQDNAIMRQLQAAGVLTDVGSAQGADQRANLGMQFDMGEMQREIERQKLAAPIDMLELQAMLSGQMPYNLFTGQTSSGSGSTSQMGFSLDLMKLGQAAMSAGKASGISDERLKQDIVPLGQGPSGDNLYAFNYLGQSGPPQYVGPMAQEVAQTRPELVEQAPSGALSVDYGALGLPSPDQQNAMRGPGSFAPEQDPLEGWSGNTGAAIRDSQQMALPNAGSRRASASSMRKRGLFGAGKAK